MACLVEEMKVYISKIVIMYVTFPFERIILLREKCISENEMKPILLMETDQEVIQQGRNCNYLVHRKYCLDKSR